MCPSLKHNRRLLKHLKFTLNYSLTFAGKELTYHCRNERRNDLFGHEVVPVDGREKAVELHFQLQISKSLYKNLQSHGNKRYACGTGVMCPLTKSSLDPSLLVRSLCSRPSSRSRPELDTLGFRTRGL